MGAEMTWTDERIGRRMKLTDLQVLRVAVETGSMGKAAQRLNTSQPAISRCIADLEQELGVMLLDRTPRGVEPTAYGRTLLDAAASAFDSLRNGIQHVGFMNDPAAGAVRIGGQEAIIAALLPPVIKELRKQYPRLSVQVRSVADVPQQYAELRERRLDLIVGRVRPPFEDDVEGEVLFEEETFVVGSVNNPWSRRRRPFRLADLMDEPSPGRCHNRGLWWARCLLTHSGTAGSSIRHVAWRSETFICIASLWRAAGSWRSFLGPCCAKMRIGSASKSSPSPRQCRPHL
jgi:DNA-binding transcriptional LysR family regulator